MQDYTHEYVQGFPKFSLASYIPISSTFTLSIFIIRYGNTCDVNLSLKNQLQVFQDHDKFLGLYQFDIC